jgi:hypothetical protein
MNMPGMVMAGFPAEMGNGKVSGALVKVNIINHPLMV